MTTIICSITNFAGKINSVYIIIDEFNYTKNIRVVHLFICFLSYNNGKNHSKETQINSL